MESNDFRAKISRLERERSVALSKIDELRVKVVDYETKVRELDIVLKYLKQWESDDANGANTSASDGPSRLPIRALVKEFCRENQEFTSAQLVAAIVARNPVAKEPSIRAELSYAKKRGDVTMSTKDQYRSERYVGSGGMQNEPGDDFGKLVS